MAQRDRDVKSDPGHRRPKAVSLMDRCLEFIDCHPRVGWYVAVLTTLNVLLNILNLFH